MAQPKPLNHPSHSHEDPAVLTPVESRQGVISGRVALVLKTSLTLAAIAFVIIYVLKIF